MLLPSFPSGKDAKGAVKLTAAIADLLAASLFEDCRILYPL